MNTQPSTLQDLVQDWTLKGFTPLRVPAGYEEATRSDDTSFSEILNQIDFFSDRFYSRFIPALFPPHRQDFRDRLLSWLNNKDLTPENQQLLFQFALKIAYLSFEDFLQLYHSAFAGPITRWIIDELSPELSDPLFQEKIEKELKQHTWYCPVTDSMVISEFYHANRITGIDQRPAFLPLQQFAQASLLEEYMAKKKLKRLVLIEDFIGSGTQSEKVVEWAVKTLKRPILFVPLVICPEGRTRFNALEKKYEGKLRVCSVLELDSSNFVYHPGKNSSELFNKLAEFIEAIHPKIAGKPDYSYGPYGFSDTGSTVVMFSNTPDNSLPILHYHSKNEHCWQALFPRVSREVP